ncbi:type VII secretion target [Actinoplanes sp. KI2]|uniref:type VII secretion target n=1 Tax=Actinoplanes sp. KI2 TaxID=2983315 RepID=UPI0021D5AB82|nr:type VII secretion target [Actinoplanes sp. KI2]MCU7725292.1 type VII secretion target [Actinoplanes sp. KI2]
MGIQIPPDDVRQHARDVDEAARMLDEARAAASYIRVSSGAYGHFVGLLIAEQYINPHGDHAIAAYVKAVDGLNGLADQLRAMADDFDNSDGRAADRLKGTR